MKNMKKLTAFVSALTLAVCAVPANVNAKYVFEVPNAVNTSNEVLDWNGNGYVNGLDGYYFINYLEYVENRPLTDFSGYLLDIESYIESEGGVEEISRKRDLNGDGITDKRDFVIFAQLTRGYSTIACDMGDVDLDNGIDATDGYMIKYYVEDLAEGHVEDYYTSSQLDTFKYYGDINEDGVIDMADADYILSGAYKEEIIAYVEEKTSVPRGTVSMEEYFADDSDSGDVNHDGFVDANDATMVLEYYAYLSVTGTVHDNSVFYTYTEEQTADMYAYGDVNKDGCVDAIDATWISYKYAENSTL